MRMRRALALLCALSCIWLSLFSAAFAVEIPPDLDDMGIDPWGDLGLIQETPEPAPTAPIGEPVGEGEDVYFLDQDAGLMMTAGADIGLMGVQFRTWAKDFNPHALFLMNSDSTPNGPYSYFCHGLLQWTDYSLFSSSDQRAPKLHLLDSFSNSSYYGKKVYRNFYDYGSVIRFSNFDINVSATPRFTMYGKLVNNIQFYERWYASSSGKYFFSESPVAVVRPIKAAYSFDGVNFTEFSTDEYDLQTGEFNFTADLTRSITELYIKFFYEPALWLKNPLFSITEPGLGMSNIGTYTFFELDHTQFHVEGVASSGGVDEETKGLLATIIEWLTSIRDGIVNVGTAIAQLPGKIANLIIDGIKSLFIPSEEDLNGLKDQYEALLSERLGFIWQAGEWITSFGSDLLSALSGGSEAEFVFPGVGFDMNGEHYQLIAEQTVDFDANGIVTVIRPFVGTIVALVVVAACVNLFHDMVGALISGKSYFDFLKGGGG